ncbi:MAG: hypothetical protein Q7T87_14170 [Polaromonas sp.]|nr:hypothetical protein [Polaromonas sp.]
MLTKPLTNEDAARIDAMDVHVIVPQQGFTISAASPGVGVAMGGGLIGAIIDSSMQSSAQRGMRADLVNFYNRVQGFDFQAEVGKTLAGPMPAMPFKVQDYRLREITLRSGEQDQAVTATAKGPAYVRLQTAYGVDAALERFTVSSFVVIWQNGRKEESYKGHLVSHVRIPAGTRDEKLAFLEKNDNGFLREETARAVTQLFSMLSLDLNERARPAGAATPEAKDNFEIPGMPGIKHRGHRIGVMQGAVVWRSAAGVLHSVPQEAS